jgi:hypothetical protein
VTGGILLQNQANWGGILLEISVTSFRWWRHHPAKRMQHAPAKIYSQVVAWTCKAAHSHSLALECERNEIS